VSLYNSDIDYHVYQESNFYYLFGVTEPNCYAMIDFKTKRASLFVPKLDNMYKIWMTVLSPKEIEERYEMDVYFIEDMAKTIRNRNPSKVYLNTGVFSDSGNPTIIPEEEHTKEFEAILDQDTVYELVSESRTTKTEQEITVMRLATKLTVEGHIEVLKQVKAGMRESHLESIFNAYCQQKYNCARI
jgi:Xaa-Pro dipeptidase